VGDLLSRIAAAPEDDARADRRVRACLFDSKRQDRLAEIVNRTAALAALQNPVTSALIDGEIAAAEPSLLLREARMLVTGIEAIYEDMLACVSVAEFDTLERLLHLARARLAEIRRALDPLLREPS
jgi:hypothetical protein